MKKIFFLFAAFFVPVFLFAESLYSPTWGFSIYIPEGYEYTDGDSRDRFSFSGPSDSKFDIIVYDGVYGGMTELVSDVNKRLGNKGDADYFRYRDKQAAIIELNFGGADIAHTGFGICVELGAGGGNGAAVGNVRPILLALAYAPEGTDLPETNELALFHLSALDSIAPSEAERLYPGIIMEYSFPRGELKQTALAKSALMESGVARNGISVMIHENDAEAAQVFVEREFGILAHYVDTPFWKEAWIRYYRSIYRDSYNRIENAVSAIVKSFNETDYADYLTDEDTKRAFAQNALNFVQGFEYERNLDGSDFVNLVTAVTEGRGDCDSRAMLWAAILSKAGIRSAMMVSPHYSHAMGLADIGAGKKSDGARFEAFGTRWLVAETTDDVDIGLIEQSVSDPQYWFGILFE